MEKKQIVKLCISGLVIALSVLYICGAFTGGKLGYEAPKIDKRAQDGTYSAQKVNNFSTVQVDMTIEKRAITDCTIQSWGASDLLTDEIRSEWASAIVESQSGSPDAITGATLVFSAESVQEAVADIMAQAVGEKEAEPIEPYTEPDPTEAEPEASTEPEVEAEPEVETEPEIEAVQSAEEDGGQTSGEADDDPDRFMRPRPVLTTAASTEATASTDDADRLMRPRPVLTADEATEAVDAPAENVEETPAEATDDADRLMRPRPVLAAAETTEALDAPAENAEETPAEATDDADRLMRPRPVLTADEATEAVDAPIEDTEEVSAEATDDADHLMRSRPILTVTEATETVDTLIENDAENSDRLMRPKPAI